MIIWCDGKGIKIMTMIDELKKKLEELNAMSVNEFVARVDEAELVEKYYDKEYDKTKITEDGVLLILGENE